MEQNILGNGKTGSRKATALSYTKTEKGTTVLPCWLREYFLILRIRDCLKMLSLLNVNVAPLYPYSTCYSALSPPSLKVSPFLKVFGLKSKLQTHAFFLFVYSTIFGKIWSHSMAGCVFENALLDALYYCIKFFTSPPLLKCNLFEYVILVEYWLTWVDEPCA